MKWCLPIAETIRELGNSMRINCGGGTSTGGRTTQQTLHTYHVNVGYVY